MAGAQETQVLDAVKRCCARWGVAKVTIDDIATESGVSRATLYRMFPGGKDVLFEALRLRELEEFFTAMRTDVEDVADLEELIVRCVVVATRELRADQHLAMMMASEPGAVLGQLTVEGLPRIIRVGTVFLAPLADRFLPRRHSARLVELLSRLVISYFLAPSERIDLGDPKSARPFVRAFVLPAFNHLQRSTTS